MNLITNSGLPDDHFIREAAIAFCAADALLLHDSKDVENAVAWSRALFAALDDPEGEWGDGRHMGDCTKQPNTCIRCVVEEYVAQARKEHDE